MLEDCPGICTFQVLGAKAYDLSRAPTAAATAVCCSLSAHTNLLNLCDASCAYVVGSASRRTPVCYKRGAYVCSILVRDALLLCVAHLQFAAGRHCCCTYFITHTSRYCCTYLDVCFRQHYVQYTIKEGL